MNVKTPSRPAHEWTCMCTWTHLVELMAVSSLERPRQELLSQLRHPELTHLLQYWETLQSFLQRWGFLPAVKPWIMAYMEYHSYVQAWVHARPLVVPNGQLQVQNCPLWTFLLGIKMCKWARHSCQEKKGSNSVGMQGSDLTLLNSLSKYSKARWVQRLPTQKESYRSTCQNTDSLCKSLSWAPLYGLGNCGSERLNMQGHTAHV